MEAIFKITDFMNCTVQKAKTAPVTITEAQLRCPVGTSDKNTILNFLNSLDFETALCPGKNGVSCKTPGSKITFVFVDLKYQDDDKINGRLINAALK